MDVGAISDTARRPVLPGLRLQGDVFVHGYVTVAGEKIGKSLGTALAPGAPIRELGLDAFRYYLLRHIGCTRDG